jgi:hypothetical protein
MGIFQNGVFGKVAGKIGGVVFGSWRGINYGRSYVKPSNPNTQAQQTQRNRFSALNVFCKPITIKILNKYYDKFTVGMSAFNRFAQLNSQKFGGVVNYLEITLGTGTLEKVNIETKEYNKLQHSANFTWNLQNLGNADDDDIVALSIFNATTQVWQPETAFYARSEGEGHINVSEHEPDADLYLYFIASRRVNGTITMVSTSEVINIVVAP